ncbi:MAG: S8 family serine peptidase [Lachnospiraceae bacterium]|nr:S8 family serine peptidase [Lachnospiraceae bacterium]
MKKIIFATFLSVLATVSLFLQGRPLGIGFLSYVTVLLLLWAVVYMIWGWFEKTEAKTRKRDRIVFISFFTSILAVFIVGGIKTYLRQKASEPTEAYYREMFEDDWAIYNYGQTVNGKPCRAGTDINIDLDAVDRGLVGDVGTIILVLDTGIDRRITCLDKRINVAEVYDFYNNDMSIYDGYSSDYHGTFVASVIAKIAPDCTMMSAKFMEGDNGNVEDAKRALKMVEGSGVRIVNCSWTFEEYDEELYEMIKDMSDVLFVCAAGDDEKDLDQTPVYPAAYDCDNIISVMANDSQGNKYQYTGYGKNRVDISAPGVDVKVVFPENDISFVDGASAAAAFVSGTAALMASEDPDLSPKEIIDILLESSTRNDGLDNRCRGMLNVKEALRLVSERKGR